MPLSSRFSRLDLCYHQRNKMLLLLNPNQQNSFIRQRAHFKQEQQAHFITEIHVVCIFSNHVLWPPFRSRLTRYRWDARWEPVPLRSYLSVFTLFPKQVLGLEA